MGILRAGGRKIELKRQQESKMSDIMIKQELRRKKKNV